MVQLCAWCSIRADADGRVHCYAEIAFIKDTPSLRIVFGIPLGFSAWNREDPTKQFGSFSFIVLFIFFNDEELTRSNFSVIDSRRVNVNEYKMRKRASICSIIRSDKASLIIAIYVEKSRTRK